VTLANALWSHVPAYSGGGAVRGDALATGQAERDRWKAIRADLLLIARLRDDWDGQGAKAPSPPVVESAFHILRLFHEGGLSVPSSVVAAPDGAVVFTWETPNSYREAEISRPGHITWMAERENRPTRHWEE
jgi:hypothetical protein